ncbi:Na+/H+ antiporter subunit A, partial [Mycobacterium sp. ITM-2017-0098]
RVAEMHRPEPAFMIPPGILAFAGLLFGLWPKALDSILSDYATTVPDPAGYVADYHLALWHGINLPLALSALVLAAGVAVYVSRGRLRRNRLSFLPLANADRIYDAVLRSADILSVRLTAL